MRKMNQDLIVPRVCPIRAARYAQAAAKAQEAYEDREMLHGAECATARWERDYPWHAAQAAAAAQADGRAAAHDAAVLAADAAYAAAIEEMRIYA